MDETSLREKIADILFVEDGNNGALTNVQIADRILAIPEIAHALAEVRKMKWKTGHSIKVRPN